LILLSSPNPIDAAQGRPHQQGLDADVLEAFRATCKGWQTRMNDALKEWLKEHAV